MVHEANTPPETSPFHRTRFELPELNTPAYIIDEAKLAQSLRRGRAFADRAGAGLLYSLKANSVVRVVKNMAPVVDGFSCSSLMEAQLAKAVLGDGQKTIHFVSPGLSAKEAPKLAEICTSISFNSLTQWDRFGSLFKDRARCALRVNPGVSLTRDPRIDACRAHSKLGIGLDQLKNAFEQMPKAFNAIEGLHVHNAVGNTDYRNLQRTVQGLETAVPKLLNHIRWINLGGGYRLTRCKNQDLFHQTVARLKTEFGLQVVIEPGTALLTDSCVLVASVVDIFTSGDKKIAVLDTSINHQLESYIYEFSPRVDASQTDGAHKYLFAGSTCLAGDLLGEHAFARPLRVGARVVFTSVGSYTHPLTTQYNGQSPPALYRLTPDNRLIEVRHYGFDDFVSRCGGITTSVLPSVI